MGNWRARWLAKAWRSRWCRAWRGCRRDTRSCECRYAENPTPARRILTSVRRGSRNQGKNVTQPAENQPGGATTRFVAETLEVLDENGYGDQKSVQIGAKNFRLLFGNQNLDGFVTLRIARVMRTEPACTSSIPRSSRPAWISGRAIS